MAKVGKNIKYALLMKRMMMTTIVAALREIRGLIKLMVDGLLTYIEDGFGR